MKHTDFLKSLKDLKSYLRATQKRKKPLTFFKEEKSKTNHCTCKDSNGETKYLYTSQKEIEYLLASKYISLHSYPCPLEKGWHLTKG